MTALTTQSQPRGRRIAPILTLACLVLLTGYLFWRGHGFYGLTNEARLDHDDYARLRPAGPIGHGYGIVGTGLILTNLLYLVRRRLPRISVGSLRAWLDVHVVSGLSGALLVAFHSTFQLRTPIATTTAVSLAVLVGTGAVGLYIYRLVPRVGRAPFEDRLRQVASVVPTFAKAARERVKAVPCTSLPHNASLLRTIFTVPRWTVEARARRRAVRQAAAVDPKLTSVAKSERALVRHLINELSDLAAAEIDANAGAALMRSWRSLHGFMALLMVLTVTVHVAVAWFYGYRWIFSR